MPFWSEAHESSTRDPKRKFRFQVSFDAITDPHGNGSVLWYAKTVSKPSFQIATTEHKYLNHTFYYPGRAEWSPIDVTFVDPTNPDQTGKLYKKLTQSGYRSPKSENFATYGFTKSKATNALGNVRIQALGPIDGAPDLDVIGEWKLWNPFFTNISWGNFSYDSEDLIELSTTIQYDYAEYTGKEIELSSGVNQATN